jgi:hypothetical protein
MPLFISTLSKSEIEPLYVKKPIRPGSMVQVFVPLPPEMSPWMVALCWLVTLRVKLTEAVAVVVNHESAISLPVDTVATARGAGNRLDRSIVDNAAVHSGADAVRFKGFDQSGGIVMQRVAAGRDCVPIDRL